MDFNSLTDSGTENHSLPSLMYIDYNEPVQLSPTTTSNTIVTLPSISLQSPDTILPKKRANKVHVSAACINCKKAHLACDISRPCNRCVSTDKADTCRDIQHKKRGRPKMQRDENNNKIRPPSINSTSITKSKHISKLSSSTNDMFMIFLSMDLCCARVSDKSLDYLQLYPQEFSQRSIYDFLLPGESRATLSKLHGYLLDNAVQYQADKPKLPSDMIRSSSEKFFSTPLEQLLIISNGSLTLKEHLGFYFGRDKDASVERQLECKLFLGGGLGADIFKEKDLDKLYIVCMIEQPNKFVKKQVDSTRIQVPSLMIQEDYTLETDYIQANEEDHSSFSSSHSSNGNSPIHSKLVTTLPSPSPPPPLPPPLTTHTASNDQQVLLDKFRYQTKPTSNQFIHPNELYYLKTTSSRLSSEAVAHTNYSYLSKTDTKRVGSGPLAHYNNQLNK